MDFPVLCACGKIVEFSNETRCEDCFALDMNKLQMSKGNPLKSVRPYAARGNPPDPDNTYEKLIARDFENDNSTKVFRSGHR